MAASPQKNKRQISDLGETELIHRFFEDQPVPKLTAAVGIGDDCAVLDDRPGYKLLVTTDQLVERVHFLQDISSARDIGYKSVAVNFSDIAAMGGQPTALFLSIALPGSTAISWLEGFRDGMFELCGQHDVPLLGGDTTGSQEDIVISVVALGRVKANNLKLRGMGQEGDILCITGPLGDSAAGLKLLEATEQSGLKREHRSYLINRHLCPRPELEEGNWLGRHKAVHAMMDLSDGLAIDSSHIASKSNVGIDINWDKIPMSEAYLSFMDIDGDEAKDLAVHGGEDYHLLCTVAGDHFQELASQFESEFGSLLHAVGKVTKKHKEIRYLKNGEPFQVSGKKFDHFNL